ncbi:uncharacterized protein, possibly involved in utilization of glycolate and propanediol [Mycolicibacterium aurum]|uniref:Uncharacterized protein, possibly involved in utilization of glycolate and propanediol n=1 Tax=Mycolicibacterium aurum TaxID=1791 RepID=A0A3S4SKA3_MYCAU|nr:heme-binding protein [Mycolicibacterium aurum]VEG55038.1 uncharacterized protein, possibly involved in utilization of glycolate and propanediol [Mycolicibacterium aurum]
MTQLVAAGSTVGASDLVQTPDMSLAVAELMLAEVKARASAQGLRLAAAVVDRGGNLVAAMRMDHAQLGASSLALDKAVTAVSFGMPTAAWIHSSAPGGSDWGLAHTLGGRAIVFPGGVPVFAGTHLVGGLGVSGAASETDAACAALAVQGQGLEVDAEETP